MHDEILIEDLNVWGTQLFLTQHPAHAELNPKLLEAIYQLRDQQAEKVDSGVAPTAKHALFESQLNLFEQDHAPLAELKSFVEDLIGMVAYNLNHPYWPEDAEPDVEVIESWYHVTQNGGYHDTHNHPNCSWCGIYYVDAGECDLAGRNGSNRFYDPRAGADMYEDAGTLYLKADGIWDFNPQDGQLVIFPSYLKHAAMPYFGQQDRVVIAFNCTVGLK